MRARSTESERKLGRWQLEHDGPDAKFGHITTSTGRIGHIYELQADTLSAHYLGENKNEKLPAKWLGYWAKINEKADEWGKEALLRFEPPNKSDVNAKMPDMHMITPERHADLLMKERWYEEQHAVQESRRGQEAQEEVSGQRGGASL